MRTFHPRSKAKRAMMEINSMLAPSGTPRSFRMSLRMVSCATQVRLLPRHARSARAVEDLPAPDGPRSTTNRVFSVPVGLMLTVLSCPADNHRIWVRSHAPRLAPPASSRYNNSPRNRRCPRSALPE